MKPPGGQMLFWLELKWKLLFFGWLATYSESVCSDPLWKAIRGISSDQQREDKLDDSPSLPGEDQVSFYQDVATERAIVSLLALVLERGLFYWGFFFFTYIEYLQSVFNMIYRITLKCNLM